MEPVCRIIQTLISGFPASGERYSLAQRFILADLNAWLRCVAGRYKANSSLIITDAEIESFEAGDFVGTAVRKWALNMFSDRQMGSLLPAVLALGSNPA
jgi:hypothetical protein